jgi:hypothetical protein
MSQLRARGRTSAIISAALALTVALAMLPRARFVRGLTRAQIWSQAHLSHSKQQPNGFAVPVVQFLPQPPLPHIRYGEDAVSEIVIRIPSLRLVRGPPLLS